MGFENDEPLDYDEFSNDVKEEKLFNDSLTNINRFSNKNYRKDSFYENVDDLSERKNSDLIYNLTNNKNDSKGNYIKNISFSYWNEDNWADIYCEKFEKM